MPGISPPRVPEGLRDMMKNLTKEVLKEKPPNIYEFSAHYFENILHDGRDAPVRSYEPAESYETIMKSRVRHQVPLSLVYAIIPDSLTELIKDFIKAVLREQPENISAFAVEYFRKLQMAKEVQTSPMMYTAYENYFQRKDRFTYTPFVKCSCGRTLGNATTADNFIIQSQTKGGRSKFARKKQSSEERNKIDNSSSICDGAHEHDANVELKKHEVENTNYNGMNYMTAVFVIQRHFRRYLTKKKAKQTDTNSKQTVEAGTVIDTGTGSMTVETAAFIIQKTFRSFFYNRRRNQKALHVAQQTADEANDNVSETASYTSASTALLSTESTGEHYEFGGSNYDEGVLQKTIIEDEEVENENLNKSLSGSNNFLIEKSIISNEKETSKLKGFANENNDLKYGQQQIIKNLLNETADKAFEKSENMNMKNFQTETIMEPENIAQSAELQAEKPFSTSNEEMVKTEETNRESATESDATNQVEPEIIKAASFENTVEKAETFPMKSELIKTDDIRDQNSIDSMETIYNNENGNENINVIKNVSESNTLDKITKGKDDDHIEISSVENTAITETGDVDNSLELLESPNNIETSIQQSEKLESNEQPENETTQIEPLELKTSVGDSNEQDSKEKKVNKRSIEESCDSVKEQEELNINFDQSNKNIASINEDNFLEQEPIYEIRLDIEPIQSMEEEETNFTQTSNENAATTDEVIEIDTEIISTNTKKETIDDEIIQAEKKSSLDLTHPDLPEPANEGAEVKEHVEAEENIDKVSAEQIDSDGNQMEATLAQTANLETQSVSPEYELRTMTIDGAALILQKAFRRFLINRRQKREALNATNENSNQEDEVTLTLMEQPADADQSNLKRDEIDNSNMLTDDEPKIETPNGYATEVSSLQSGLKNNALVIEDSLKTLPKPIVESGTEKKPNEEPYMLTEYPVLTTSSSVSENNEIDISKSESHLSLKENDSENNGTVSQNAEEDDTKELGHSDSKEVKFSSNENTEFKEEPISVDDLMKSIKIKSVIEGENDYIIELENDSSPQTTSKNTDVQIDDNAETSNTLADSKPLVEALAVDLEETLANTSKLYSTSDDMKENINQAEILQNSDDLKEISQDLLLSEDTKLPAENEKFKEILHSTNHDEIANEQDTQNPSIEENDKENEQKLDTKKISEEEEEVKNDDNVDLSDAVKKSDDEKKESLINEDESSVESNTVAVTTVQSKETSNDEKEYINSTENIENSSNQTTSHANEDDDDNAIVPDVANESKTNYVAQSSLTDVTKIQECTTDEVITKLNDTDGQPVVAQQISEEAVENTDTNVLNFTEQVALEDSPVDPIIEKVSLNEISKDNQVSNDATNEDVKESNSTEKLLKSNASEDYLDVKTAAKFDTKEEAQDPTQGVQVDEINSQTDKATEAKSENIEIINELSTEIEVESTNYANPVITETKSDEDVKDATLENQFTTDFKSDDMEITKISSTIKNGIKNSTHESKDAIETISDDKTPTMALSTSQQLEDVTLESQIITIENFDDLETVKKLSAEKDADDDIQESQVTTETKSGNTDTITELSIPNTVEDAKQTSDDIETIKEPSTEKEVENTKHESLVKTESVPDDVESNIEISSTKREVDDVQRENQSNNGAKSDDMETIKKQLTPIVNDDEKTIEVGVTDLQTENLNMSAKANDYVSAGATTTTSAYTESADIENEGKNQPSRIVENKPIGTQNLTESSTELSNNKNLLTNPKKSHSSSNKDKKMTSSLDSGRLIPGPIAELQLKSFKTPEDAGPWYEVHMEPNEVVDKKNMSASMHIPENESDKLIEQPLKVIADDSSSIRTDAEQLENPQAIQQELEDLSNYSIGDIELQRNVVKTMTELISSKTERAPTYFFGAPVQSEQEVKEKTSVTFFVPFKDNNKTISKTNLKPQNVETSDIIPENGKDLMKLNTNETVHENGLKDPLEATEDDENVVLGATYTIDEVLASKPFLQTIPEQNENDSHSPSINFNDETIPINDSIVSQLNSSHIKEPTTTTTQYLTEPISENFKTVTNLLEAGNESVEREFKDENLNDIKEINDIKSKQVSYSEIINDTENNKTNAILQTSNGNDEENSQILSANKEHIKRQRREISIENQLNSVSDNETKSTNINGNSDDNVSNNAINEQNELNQDSKHASDSVVLQTQKKNKQLSNSVEVTDQDEITSTPVSTYSTQDAVKLSDASLTEALSENSPTLESAESNQETVVVKAMSETLTTPESTQDKEYPTEAVVTNTLSKTLSTPESRESTQENEQSSDAVVIIDQNEIMSTLESTEPIQDDAQLSDEILTDALPEHSPTLESAESTQEIKHPTEIVVVKAMSESLGTPESTESTQENEQSSDAVVIIDQNEIMSTVESTDSTQDDVQLSDAILTDALPENSPTLESAESTQEIEHPSEIVVVKAMSESLATPESTESTQENEQSSDAVVIIDQNEIMSTLESTDSIQDDAQLSEAILTDALPEQSPTLESAESTLEIEHPSEIVVVKAMSESLATPESTESTQKNEQSSDAVVIIDRNEIMSTVESTDSTQDDVQLSDVILTDALPENSPTLESAESTLEIEHPSEIVVVKAMSESLATPESTESTQENEQSSDAVLVIDQNEIMSTVESIDSVQNDVKLYDAVLTNVLSETAPTVDSAESTINDEYSSEAIVIRAASETLTNSESTESIQKKEQSSDANVIINQNEIKYTQDKIKEFDTNKGNTLYDSSMDTGKKIHDDINDQFVRMMHAAPSPPSHEPSIDDTQEVNNMPNADVKILAVIKIQKAFRSYLKRRSNQSISRTLPTNLLDLNKSEMAHTEDDPKRSAATKIQRAFRTFILRQQQRKANELSNRLNALLANSGKNQDPSVQYTNADILAATIIQKAFRSYILRKSTESASVDLSSDMSQITEIFKSKQSDNLNSLDTTSSLNSADNIDAQSLNSYEATAPPAEEILSSDESMHAKSEWFVGNEPIVTTESRNEEAISTSRSNSSNEIDTLLVKASIESQSIACPELVNQRSSLETNLPIGNNDANEQVKIKSINENYKVNDSVGTDIRQTEGIQKPEDSEEAKSVEVKEEVSEEAKETASQEAKKGANEKTKQEVSRESKEKSNEQTKEDVGEEINLMEIVKIANPNEGANLGLLLTDFLANEREFSGHQKKSAAEAFDEALVSFKSADTEIPYEVMEEPCIKKTVSLSNLDEENLIEIPSVELKDKETPDSLNSESTTADLGNETDLETSIADKLSKADEVIEKMTQRRASETQTTPQSTEKLKQETSFDEPIIRPMSALQDSSSTELEDGDIVVVSPLPREDTRESSAQSDSVVFGENESEMINRIAMQNLGVVKTPLKRLYTIAGEDPKTIFKSVTIDDTIKYIEPADGDLTATSGSSFCLDDDISENIRQKMMAYSLSEADSDYFEASHDGPDTSMDRSGVTNDDFNISTALADTPGTSTETESTIVSAATKIQAGARGFLTRRRLRRTSGGTKSSTQETKASFGNDAISESLERLIEDEAAKKIQTAYRKHYYQRKQNDTKEDASLENSLAARRLTLQRGDALRNDSTPDEEHSGSGNSNDSRENSKKTSGDVKSTDSKKSLSEYKLNWQALRQNSMPVQIDCEVFRVIPKHMRKRIRSAENEKKIRRTFSKNN